MENAKRVSDSLSTQTYIIMPSHLNPAGSLFGGQLLSWIDMIAGIVVRRHTNGKSVTVAIDHLEFKKPSKVGDIVTLIGRITWVGNTSMEVRVDSYREKRTGAKELINTAYIIMVAIGDDDRPITVPRLILETDEERAEWQAGEKRAENRKQRREEHF